MTKLFISLSILCTSMSVLAAAGDRVPHGQVEEMICIEVGDTAAETMSKLDTALNVEKLVGATAGEKELVTFSDPISVRGKTGADQICTKAVYRTFIISG